jgi:hypothetical protein
LSETQLSSVNVTIAQAITVAEAHELVSIPPSDTPNVVLGSFTDSEYGTAGSGTTSNLIASNMPAFVVSFDDVSLPSSGPVGGSETGQYDVVINAVTGAYVMAFSGP